MSTVLLNGHNACADVDPDLFHPLDNEGIEAAKAICATCPLLIRKRCLKVGLAQGHQHGVWGGKSAAERRAMKRLEPSSTDRPAGQALASA